MTEGLEELNGVLKRKDEELRKAATDIYALQKTVDSHATDVDRLIIEDLRKEKTTLTNKISELEGQLDGLLKRIEALEAVKERQARLLGFFKQAALKAHPVSQPAPQQTTSMS